MSGCVQGELQMTGGTMDDALATELTSQLAGIEMGDIDVDEKREDKREDKGKARQGKASE